MRSGLAVCPEDRLTVTVCSDPFEAFQNTAPRAGTNGAVHPLGVLKLGVPACGTTTTAISTFPGIGDEARVAVMLRPLELAFLDCTAEIVPGVVVVTVKLDALIAVPPGASIAIGPVVAVAGTIAVTFVSELTM